MTGTKVADDWQRDVDGRVRLRRPFTQVVRGREVFVENPRHIWTADELDLMEELAEKALTCEAMRWYFDPVPSADAIRCAMMEAGIDGRWKRFRKKKPSEAEVIHWAEMLAEWQSTRRRASA